MAPRATSAPPAHWGYRSLVDRSVPTLIGAGVVLRAVRADDVGAIVPISFYDGRAARDEADAAAMLERIRADVARGESLHWGICVGGSDLVVGTVGFYRGFSDGTGELGYVLSEAFRGSGIMTRAVAAVVAYGLGPLGLSRVEAMTDRDNLASQAVLRRVGFRLVDETGPTWRFVVSADDAVARVLGERFRGAFRDLG